MNMQNSSRAQNPRMVSKDYIEYYEHVPDEPAYRCSRLTRHILKKPNNQCITKRKRNWISYDGINWKPT
jgi:hypothetical protein